MSQLAGATRDGSSKSGEAAPRVLDDLLAIEDDPAVAEIACSATGVPLWPLLRAQVLRGLISDLFYRTPIEGGTTGSDVRAAMTGLARATAHNAVRPSWRSEVLVMGTGVGNQIIDGRWFNRLSDPFAMALPTRSLLVEDMYRWAWPLPRHNERVRFHAPIQARAAIVGRALARDEHVRQSRRLLELVCRRARRLIGWEPGAARFDGWVTTLARKAAAMPWLAREYQLLLARVQPRVLLKEEACYGTSAVLLSTAARLGIVTAEYQHGVVSSGHDAYNIAPALASSPTYRRTLPQFFLGYGRWWNDQIRVPVEKRAIGNPHRTRQLERYADRSVAAARVLVLGDGVETDLYIDLARRLATALQGRMAVSFRPHPMEREKVRSHFTGAAAECVTLDTHDDIYGALASVEAVVSELSTGLFEAVGLVRKIFVWDTPKSRFALHEHPFATFVDVDDLTHRLLGDATSTLTPEQERSIWEHGWQENYLRFLAEVGVEGAA